MLLSTDLTELKDNVATKFIDRWRENKNKEGAEKTINQNYEFFIKYYNSSFFNDYRIKTKDKYPQMIKLMKSINYMESAIARKGPPQ